MRQNLQKHYLKLFNRLHTPAVIRETFFNCQCGATQAAKQCPCGKNPKLANHLLKVLPFVFGRAIYLVIRDQVKFGQQLLEHEDPQCVQLYQFVLFELVGLRVDSIYIRKALHMYRRVDPDAGKFRDGRDFQKEGRVQELHSLLNAFDQNSQQHMEAVKKVEDILSFEGKKKLSGNLQSALKGFVDKSN